MTNEEAWSYAEGIVCLDGGHPSAELKKLIEMEKKGLISKHEIKQFLIQKYSHTGKE